MQKVVVEAPASSANLGPGFDVFAVALREPKDRLEIEAASAGKGRVTLKVGGVGDIGAGRKNAVGAVVLSMMRKYSLNSDVSIRLTKGVPVGVGLGSSGASSAAAAVAMDSLFGLRMGVAELVAHAGEGERAASGEAHFDNVAASIAGGFVIVRPGERPEPIGFGPPKALALVVVTPRVTLPSRKTEYARSLVPSTVPTSSMVSNVARASTIVAGFAKGDVRMIGEGMEDAVVEVSRAKMIPGFMKVKKAAKEAGASGVCISGAGPSMISFVDRVRVNPRLVLDAMAEAFNAVGAKAEGFVTKVGEGAKLVEYS